MSVQQVYPGPGALDVTYTVRESFVSCWSQHEHLLVPDAVPSSSAHGNPDGWRYSFDWFDVATLSEVENPGKKRLYFTASRIALWCSM